MPPADRPRTGGPLFSGVPEGELSHLSASLMRGLSILHCFTPRRPVWSAGQIAEALGIGVTSARRYLTTLAVMGYLVELHDGDDEPGSKREPIVRRERRYRLGLRVTDLGLAAVNGTGLREHAEPHLRRLREQTARAASLAVLDGPEIVYLEHIPSHRSAQDAAGVAADDDRDFDAVHSRPPAPGSRRPAHATALGKALLAHVSVDERHHLVDEVVLHAYTPATIVDRAAFSVELDDICDAGFALADEEYAAGVIALAVAVRDVSTHVVAAVGICARAPETTIDELIDTALDELQAAAAAVSAQLGYRAFDYG